jgi:hypothetical protein
MSHPDTLKLVPKGGQAKWSTKPQAMIQAYSSHSICIIHLLPFFQFAVCHGGSRHSGEKKADQ